MNAEGAEEDFLLLERQSTLRNALFGVNQHTYIYRPRRTDYTDEEIGIDIASVTRRQRIGVFTGQLIGEIEDIVNALPPHDKVQVSIFTF